MNIFILTLFPEMFVGPFNHSILKRAQEKKLATISFINIRDFANDKHGTVDDKPYGGGLGMIMKIDVLDSALSSITSKIPKHEKTIILLLDPKGEEYTQKKAQELTQFNNLILLCGHYEGVDARITTLIDGAISVGAYVVTGGEIPAMAVVDSVVRLIPGVLKPEATTHESYTNETLEYPQYTRPYTYKGSTVPEVLLHGNHREIQKWKEANTKKLVKPRLKLK